MKTQTTKKGTNSFFPPIRKKGNYFHFFFQIVEISRDDYTLLNCLNGFRAKVPYYTTQNLLKTQRR